MKSYVGVLNRSHQDVIDGRDIAYSLEKEEKFFAANSCYKDMADRMGTKYLRKTLNEQLYLHIKQYLPSVRKELSQKLASAHKELKDIRENVNFDVRDPYSVQDYTIKLTQKFVEKLQIEIFGYSELVSTDELSAGTMINFQLYKSIQNLKLPEVPAKRKLLTVLANSSGVRNFFTMPSLSLETVFRQLISTYIDPLNLLVDDIADILDSTVEKLSIVLSHFPNFRNELIFLIRKSISEAASETKETLEKHLQAEMYFVNTCHKDFNFPDVQGNETLFPIKLWENRCLKNSNSVVSSGTSSRSSICTTNDATDSGIDEMGSNQIEAIESIEADKSAQASADILAKTIEKCISNQQKHIEDMAFKYILFFLVKQVMDFVKSELLGRILNSVDKEIICQDCEKDFNRLEELESICKYLEDTMNAIQTF